MKLNSFSARRRGERARVLQELAANADSVNVLQLERHTHGGIGRQVEEEFVEPRVGSVSNLKQESQDDQISSGQHVHKVHFHVVTNSVQCVLRRAMEVILEQLSESRVQNRSGDHRSSSLVGLELNSVAVVEEFTLGERKAR